MKRPSSIWIVHFALLAAFAVVLLRAVDEPHNDFRFAVIGDRTGGPQPQIYGRVWREVDLFHPEFVINVGDTIQGSDDATALDQWRQMRPIWARYSHYPLYFTPGNHDVWSEYSRQLFEQESRRKSYYSFDYQDAHFTVLDTAEAKVLTDEQLDFLERDLAAAADKDPKFVFFHHPFWIGRFQAEDDEFPFHELVKRYGVDYVVSGHGHQFVRMVRDGIVYMEVGSSGGTMNAGLLRGEGFKDGRFYHWVWMHVKNGKITATVKEIGGQMGEGRMFDADLWDENGPKFDVADPALTNQPET